VARGAHTSDASKKTAGIFDSVKLNLEPVYLKVFFTLDVIVHPKDPEIFFHGGKVFLLLS